MDAESVTMLPSASVTVMVTVPETEAVKEAAGMEPAEARLPTVGPTPGLVMT